MAWDVDSLAAGAVSSEDLAEGAVQVSADDTSASVTSASEAPIDSGVVEAAYREMLASKQKESEGAEEESPQEAQGEEQDEDEVEEEQPKPQKKDRSAQARIRELNAQKKEYQQKFEQAQQQYAQQQQQWNQQIQAQQAQFQQKLLDLENRRLEMAREEKSRAELAQMSEPERRAYEFRQQLETEAANKAEAKVSAKLTELQQQVAEFKQWKDGAAEHAKASQREKQMQQMVNQALDTHVLRNVKSAHVGTVRPVMEEMLTLYAAAYGVPPEQIAPQFLKFMDTWATVRTDTIAQSAGNTLKKGKALPSAAAAKSAAPASKVPTLSDLRKLGYENYVQYRAAQAKGKVR